MSSGSRTSETRVPWVAIVGHSNAGKTTLIERLIPRLRRQGLRIGTVKHAHQGFDMDHRGKDSWRHARAGAQAVAIVGPSQAAWFFKTPRELRCAEAVGRFGGDQDLILVEGFKRQRGPQIQLGAPANGRVTFDEATCRVGAPVTDLRPAELERIARFCVNVARGGKWRVRTRGD